MKPLKIVLVAFLVLFIVNTAGCSEDVPVPHAKGKTGGSGDTDAGSKTDTSGKKDKPSLATLLQQMTDNLKKGDYDKARQLFEEAKKIKQNKTSEKVDLELP
ncbi:MAG: hypothetical protein GY757_02470, partial [bacterium]|nr:hypothetical protein [bacterium]